MNSRRTADERVDRVEVEIERYELLGHDRTVGVIGFAGAQVAQARVRKLDHPFQGEPRQVPALGWELPGNRRFEISRPGDRIAVFLADHDVARLDAQLEHFRKAVFLEEW